MNIKEILGIPSLKNSTLVAGESGITKEINSVNILEALDVEKWARNGEVILTSYFALKDLNDNEIETFFKKLDEIQISAIIIKINRLLTKIPSKIIDLCNRYSIPLIKIGNDIKYESIILEILGPIINKNISILNKYYYVHSELTNLAMQVPNLNSVLLEFKNMLNRDISLINESKNTVISTNALLDDVTILNTSKISNDTYMHFDYIRKEVRYNLIPPKVTGYQIRVKIPYLTFNDYELIIHELDKKLNSEDYMILENAVKFLQLELLKRYTISQNLFQHKNNIISDLLNNKLYEKKDIDDVLTSIKLEKDKYYQILLLKLYPKDSNKNFDNQSMLPVLTTIRNRFKIAFKSVAFLEKTDRIVFLFNLPENEDSINLDYVGKILNSLIENNVLKDFHYRVSISSRVEKYDIPEANKQVLDTQKVLKLFHNSNKILTYDELGIYKLFLDANNLDNLSKFISPKIKILKNETPQLFETLEVFLESNKNYVLTSEKLFLHPKTVRYRIDKIKEILKTDLTDPEEILQIQISARLFKLKDWEENN